MYDALGRVLTKTQSVGAGASAKTFAVSYRYAQQRLTDTILPSGRDIAYSYDAQGRVSGISVSGQALLGSVKYFPFGGVAGWTWANGQKYVLGFDLDGRVSALTLGPDTSSYPADSWTLGYDSMNRLTTTAAPGAQSFAYAYDVVGNRTQETANSATTTYSYATTSNRLQSLTGTGAKSFGYDNAGNTTTSGPINLTYDGRGRLMAAGGTTYQVNGLGQRVAKSGPSTPTGTNYFVYDEAGHLLGEYDATATAIQETVWLGDLPVATLRPPGGSTGTFNIYPDHLGSPRVVTRFSDNAIVWRWDNSEPFGATLANSNPSGLGTFTYNLRFPGQYYDAETGTHYNYFRDYDPSVGRYEQSDPIGLAGGVNTYGYVRSSPLRWTDPDGLRVQQCCRKATALGGRTGVSHCWIKTDLLSGGMNSNPDGSCSIAGAQYEFPYITDVYVNDHSCDIPDKCFDVDDVDEDCVNKEIGQFGRPLGSFTLFNQCQNYVYDVLVKCSKRKPWMRPQGRG